MDQTVNQFSNNIEMNTNLLNSNTNSGTFPQQSTLLYNDTLITLPSFNSNLLARHQTFPTSNGDLISENSQLQVTSNINNTYKFEPVANGNPLNIIEQPMEKQNAQLLTTTPQLSDNNPQSSIVNNSLNQPNTPENADSFFDVPNSPVIEPASAYLQNLSIDWDKLYTSAHAPRPKNSNNLKKLLSEVDLTEFSDTDELKMIAPKVNILTNFLDEEDSEKSEINSMECSNCVEINQESSNVCPISQKPKKTNKDRKIKNNYPDVRFSIKRKTEYERLMELRLKKVKLTIQRIQEPLKPLNSNSNPEELSNTIVEEIMLSYPPCQEKISVDENTPLEFPNQEPLKPLNSKVGAAVQIEPPCQRQINPLISVDEDTQWGFRFKEPLGMLNSIEKIIQFDSHCQSQNDSSSSIKENIEMVSECHTPEEVSNSTKEEQQIDCQQGPINSLISVDEDTQLNVPYQEPLEPLNSIEDESIKLSNNNNNNNNNKTPVPPNEINGSKTTSKTKRRHKIIYNCRCFDCSESFDRLEYLSFHVEFEHGHACEYESKIVWRMLSCIYCGFSTYHLQNIDNHLKKFHSGLQNIFSCNFKVNDKKKYTSQILSLLNKPSLINS